MREIISDGRIYNGLFSPRRERVPEAKATAIICLWDCVSLDIKRSALISGVLSKSAATVIPSQAMKKNSIKLKMAPVGSIAARSKATEKNNIDDNKTKQTARTVAGRYKHSIHAFSTHIDTRLAALRMAKPIRTWSLVSIGWFPVI
jgi:hypothetical protein